MIVDQKNVVRTIFDNAVAAHQRFVRYGLDGVVEAAAAIGAGLANGGKLLAFGNGGSASDAQHLVAELVGRFQAERRALSAIALTADSSILTAIANDYGYHHVFSRQIEGLGCAGDVAFGISTSGSSKNVEAALTVARSRGLITIALTGGTGGRMGAHADIHLNVAETSTSCVQEVHRTVLHAVCSLIDAHLI